MLHSYTPPPPELTASWAVSLCELPLQLLAEQLPAQRVDLLQGEFRKVSQWKQQWQQWRLPVILAGLCLGLFLTGQTVEYYRLQQQQQQLQQQMTSLYRTLFPAEKRVVNPRAQLKQHLQALQSAPQENSFLEQLAQLAPQLPQSAGVELQQLRFDAEKQEFRLQVTAKNFSVLDQLRTQLASVFTAEMTNMQNQGGQTSGTLIIRSKA
ncbi:MAG: hypothetical protein E6Q86_06105 [Tolumonas sp.]|nr:MAG: hypothetical protein E6Q86_06105 [Tolumonas sp.]